MGLPKIHLRAEQKPLEHRSFSPAVIGALVAAGFPVSVEHSPTDPAYRRIFADDEYAAVGATLVETGSWPTADPGTVVIGLKELPEDEDFPLTNDHITFAHCYKNQGGWESVLGRWARGGGTLYDLEFLVDENGRRVSAFGYHAGFAGAALGTKAWAWQLSHPASEPLPAVSTFTSDRGYYLDEAELVSQIRADIAAAGRVPSVMVLGALGRCGRGAVDLFVKAGVPEDKITRWDIGETKDRQGPYEEIRQHDIFVNAIYLSDPIPPFVNPDMLAKEGRALRVVVDVSCDTTNPHNPLPIYSINTTFTSPTVPAPIPTDAPSNPPLSVISIDHFPSMLPRESSESFSDGLRESLLLLGDRGTARVWADAKKLFDQKVALLPERLRTLEVNEI